MMQWAVVNLIEMDMNSYNFNTQQWEIVNAQPGTIVNMVVYDGENPNGWNPPEGTKIIQVDDTAKIGDTGY